MRPFKHQFYTIMSGNKITMAGGKLQVPSDPIIPFIEGDGTGPDIWRSSVRVLDAAVEKAYQGKKRLFGKKSWPAKRRSIRPGTGSPTKHWLRSRNTWSASKAR